MSGLLDACKFALLVAVAGCVAYSTWLLHRVVEEGHWVHVAMPQDTGRLEERTIPVRIVDEPITVRLRDSVILNDSTPVRVQTIGPVDTNSFVTIMNKAPIRVELSDTPVPVRPVR